MQEFTVDDGGYERWLVANQDQYVVNTTRGHAPSLTRLHRADCRTINGTPPRGTTWVGEQIELCGTREELERAWPGAPACKTCR